jgi:hypothetical protein
MSDRVIREGFPEGWFVQDRIKSGEALLCGPHITFGSTCICLRPGAITTDEWLPTARRIANALVDASRAETNGMTDARSPKPAVVGWRKKFKGSERGRGGALIHTHPDAERAIVENHRGIMYDGQSYSSLDAAKAAALKGKRAEPSRQSTGWRWQFEANGPWHTGVSAPEGVYHSEPVFGTA